MIPLFTASLAGMSRGAAQRIDQQAPQRHPAPAPAEDDLLVDLGATALILDPGRFFRFVTLPLLVLTPLELYLAWSTPSQARKVRESSPLRSMAGSDQFDM